MAKKSELLKKKWSQLSSSERDLFKSKSAFSRRKQAQLTINQGTPKKPKKAAITAIQQDEGKLKPRDIKKISKETGVSPKKITKLAINRVPDKIVSKKVDTSNKPKKPKKAAITSIQQDEGKLKPKDVERISEKTGLSPKKITKLAINRVPDKTVSKKVNTSNKPKKPKKAAVTAIQKDKGKLKPKDIERISNETGVSPKKITKLAINRVPDKIVSEKSENKPKKPKKAAVTAIQQDKGKLKPKDVERISEETGLSPKKITKLATNRVPDKIVSKKVDTLNKPKKPKKAAVTAIQQDKGKLKPRDIERISNETGLSPKKIAKLAANRVPDKIISKKVDTSGKKDGFDPDYDPLGDIEFPKGTSGKDFRKYKTQRGKIGEAAEKDLENRMKKSIKPKVLGKAAKLKEKFLGDPNKKPKKLIGRAKREYQIQQVEERQKDLGIKRKPKFEVYEKRVEKIREGKGAAKEYAYSGRFDKLGKKLGVKYGEKAREKRTESRLTDLRKNLGAGPKKTYTTAADNVKSQRRKGRKAMEAFKIGENQNESKTKI